MIPLIIAGAVAAASAASKGIAGYNQQKAAMEAAGKAKNPGYEKNPGLAVNEGVLRNRFLNYVTPGSSSAIDEINSLAGSGYSAAREGATNSTDLLAAATRIAYGSQNQIGNILESSASGKEGALRDWLSSNAALGQESVNANQWDREMFLRNKQDAANLQNAGTINQMGAFDDLVGNAMKLYFANQYGGQNLTSNINL